MKMDQQLSKMLFDMWMDQHHPNYFWRVGIVMIILALSFVCSIVFIWVFSWWWKMMLTTIGLSLLVWFFNRIMVSNFVDEFNSSDKKVMTCNKNMPPLPELTCNDIAHFSEIRGDEIWINGRYMGHITAIKGLEVRLEYKGDNQYLRGQKSVMHVDAGTAAKIKGIAL